ncbi:MAG: epoxyqueuosine reductase QueH [Fervidobacterium sp.]|uniref:epoxyqueuosine reductase QueH n=1 Tax=Fervidobacterium sp. TaxID=1871331 RepID=UPI00404B4C08
MENTRYILKNDAPSCHLLHVCCAPDLVISYLAGARGDVFFYNPNIHPRSEYEKRYEEVLKVAELFKMNVVEVPYDPETFFEKTKGLENEPEGRKRCEICIRMRLEKTLEFAKENGYRSFSTTLTASPKKSVEMINNAGINVSRYNLVQYIPNVYRKSPLYNQAQKLIKQLGIYRQNYCGCVFSIRNEDKEKGEEIR